MTNKLGMEAVLKTIYAKPSETKKKKIRFSKIKSMCACKDKKKEKK